MSLKIKCLLILGIILFFYLSIKYAKRKGISYDFNPKLNDLKTDLDDPIDFGYKSAWLAIKTADKKGIIESWRLQNITPSNWESGITKANKRGLYITPGIGPWTLVYGMELFKYDNKEKMVELDGLLNALSLRFGEAHFFGTHRVIEYHAWIKSRNGTIERSYSYLGESGETISNYGETTKAENGLAFFDFSSSEADNPAYWDREDLVFPDEEMVLNISEIWSINPMKLSTRNDIQKELGFYATMQQN